jgi:hypothetical protein
LQVPHLPFKVSGARANILNVVRITGGNFPEVQLAADLFGEGVLLKGATAIKHFHRLG